MSAKAGDPKRFNTRLVPRGHGNTWERGEQIDGPGESSLRATLFEKPSGARRVDVEGTRPRPHLLARREEGGDVSLEVLREWAVGWMAGHETAIDRLTRRRT